MSKRWTKEEEDAWIAYFRKGTIFLFRGVRYCPAHHPDPGEHIPLSIERGRTA